MAFDLNRFAELPVAQRISDLSLWNKRTFLVAGLSACLVYAGLFAVPKRVSFSYAGPTCTGTVTLFPDMHRATDVAKFRLQYSSGISIGRVRVTATKLCFEPIIAPQTGKVRLASAPLGGWMFRSHYEVIVSEAPRILGVTAPPQALSQPVSLKLNRPDTVYKYELSVGGKAQPCTVNSAQLLCKVDKLGLAQGASYALSFRRSFEGKTSGTPTSIQLAILPATKVTATSIRADEMVFTKPRSAEFTLDKPLTTAVAKLELIEGDKVALVDTQSKVDDARVIVTWPDDLPREKSFRLSLTAAAAGDGSRLDGAQVISFRTSGGPKVVDVSGGGAVVAADARVVVSFDQALSKDTNIAALAGITGGSAAITWRGGNQVVFALRNIPRCGAFSLTIAMGLVSENGIAATEGWSQASRVNCRSTRTIGTSASGRPILAYFYGTGPATVLFTGGIHGNEPSGTYIMQDWAAHLDANAYKIPAGKQVVVIPNLNPDGTATGQRYNANNVNLDRNFPTSDWISDITAQNGQVLPHGGGTSPLSEPETRAFTDIASSLKLRAEISFHSSGALVGANKVADSLAIGGMYASSVGYGTVFENPEATFGYSLTGELETWLGEKYGTPAILIELPTSNGRYFTRHQDTLWNMVKI